MGDWPARTLIIPGWNHVAAEVFYDGRWHYFDLDVRAVFRREDGTLASMDEARADASLWRQPNSPLFFPLDNLGSVQRAYAKTPAEHRYGVASGGHTMDFVLRQGETFTRWWKPQGGRWNHHPSYATKPFPRTVIEREPRGPKSKHESFTIHTHGNGRFVYRPNLTARSSDFEDGVYEAQNVEPGPSGLTLKSPGEGYAIFEVRTPYVIAPLVGDLDTTADDREASVVKLDAAGVSLALSLDNGLTLAAAGRCPTAPSTSHSQVAGRYGYLLKLELRGQPEQTMVRSLEIVTWVQVHPASLPSLRKGKNTMRLVTGDHYGLPTRVLAVCPSAADREEFLKCLVEPPRDYDPAGAPAACMVPSSPKLKPRPARRSRGSRPAAASRLTWAPRNNTRNAIAYAVERIRQAFREIYRAERALRPKSLALQCGSRSQARQTGPHAFWCATPGDPAVNNLRLFAHCVEDRPRGQSPGGW